MQLAGRPAGWLAGRLGVVPAGSGWPGVAGNLAADHLLLWYKRFFEMLQIQWVVRKVKIDQIGEIRLV